MIIAIEVEVGEIEMDLDVVTTFTTALDDDKAKQVSFVQQTGTLSSALEHAVPEQMFTTDPANPPNAVSAVKALSIANAQGQRIYQITAANQAAILPHIHHDSATMQEIRAALAVGKTVITHTDAVSVPGWSGAGYIILDPETGEGAYKIGGGLNGGFQDLLDAFVFLVAGALGYVDGKTGLYLGQKFMFADRLNYFAKMARASQVIGGLGLLVSAALIFSDDNLTFSQKLGQVSMTLLGYGITAYVTTAAVALTGVGALAIAVAIFVALTMTLATILINAIYFSYYWNLRVRNA